MGAVILILYGIVPTYQPSHFGLVYAAYGGCFIILSILWGGWSITWSRIDSMSSARWCVSLA